MDLFWDLNSSWSAPWVRQTAAFQQPPPQPQVSYGYYNNNYYASGDYNYASYAYGQPPATYVPPTNLEIREELQSIRDDFRSILKSFRSLVENLQAVQSNRASDLSAPELTDVQMDAKKPSEFFDNETEIRGDGGDVPSKETGEDVAVEDVDEEDDNATYADDDSHADDEVNGMELCSTDLEETVTHEVQRMEQTFIMITADGVQSNRVVEMSSKGHDMEKEIYFSVFQPLPNQMIEDVVNLYELATSGGNTPSVEAPPLLLEKIVIFEELYMNFYVVLSDDFWCVFDPGGDISPRLISAHPLLRGFHLEDKVVFDGGGVDTSISSR